MTVTERKDWPCGWRPGPYAHDPCSRCGWAVHSHHQRPPDEPHHPNRWYRCDDPDCCYDGCPDLTCAVCGEDWPCATKREHVAARKLARAG